MKNLIFDIYNLSHKDKAIATARREFDRAGAQVTSVDVASTTKKALGVEYREVQFGFADSQNVLFGITATGDVAQVKLNGKVVAMKNQDDHGKAIAEIVTLMTKGRAKFQAALARKKVALPLPSAQLPRSCRPACRSSWTPPIPQSSKQRPGSKR